MPRYYFNFRDDKLLEDDEGRDLPDLAEARKVAVAEARSIACAQVLEGRLSLRDVIEVVDEERRAVFTLPIGEAVRIEAPT